MKQTNDNRCRNRNYLVKCLAPARLAAPTCCYSHSAALGLLCCSRLTLLLFSCLLLLVSLCCSLTLLVSPAALSSPATLLFPCLLSHPQWNSNLSIGPKVASSSLAGAFFCWTFSSDLEYRSGILLLLPPHLAPFKLIALDFCKCLVTPVYMMLVKTTRHGVGKLVQAGPP